MLDGVLLEESVDEDDGDDVGVPDPVSAGSVECGECVEGISPDGRRDHGWNTEGSLFACEASMLFEVRPPIIARAESNTHPFYFLHD